MAESAPHQEPLIRTLAGGSEYFFDYVCQPCTMDNKTLEAVGFCVTCTELLCDDCYRNHLKPTLTRNHKLLDIEDAKKDKNFASSRDLCTEICPQHLQEIIKYFCKTHNTLGCTACMTEDHRTCKDVQHIPKVAEAEANGQDYTGLIKELDTVLLRTRRLIQDSTDNKAKSQKLCDGVLDDVRQAKTEVIEAFEKLEKDMEMEADKTKNKQIQKVDEKIAVFDNIQQRAEALVKSLKSMKANGQYCKLFTAMKVEKSDVQSLEAKLDKEASDNTIADFKFQSCRELEELLKCKDSLGELLQNSRETNNTATLAKQSQEASSPSSKTASSEGNPKSHGSVRSKAKKVGEISLKTPDDSGQFIIYGLASLSNGKIVAADYCKRNVKLIDVQQARVVSALSVSSAPQDITATDEPGTIAVTLAAREVILVVKVTGNSLLKDREIKTSSSCYGIASLKGNMVVSLVNPVRLEIIDMHGNMLRRIKFDQHGKQLFHQVLSLAVSQQGDAIYVPDYKMKTMTCLSATGEVMDVYKPGELRGIRGRSTAVDNRGVVYFGGDDSNDILQIIPDSKEVSVLLSRTGGMNNFRSMCYTADTNCLLVGQDGDSILIYQLS